MKRMVIVALAVVATLAWAGKPERDKQKEVTPLVATHAKTVKTACGCDVKFDVKWDSYKKADDMWRVKETAEAFAKAATAYCESDEDKKAFCANVKSVSISFSADVGDVAYNEKAKSFAAHSNESSYNGDHQFKAFLDKL